MISRAGAFGDDGADEVFDVVPVVGAFADVRRADGERFVVRQRDDQLSAELSGESFERVFRAAWIVDGGADQEQIVGEFRWFAEDYLGGIDDELALGQIEHAVAGAGQFGGGQVLQARDGTHEDPGEGHDDSSR
ncbi:hypothetical protein GCM10028799_43570 [Kribbella italica]